LEKIKKKILLIKMKSIFIRMDSSNVNTLGGTAKAALKVLNISLLANFLTAPLENWLSPHKNNPGGGNGWR
jgi:hypothetical protein